MSKIISAGILLESNKKFLLGHPTELTGTTHGWGILKGKRDDNEPLLTAAFREFSEEAGIDLFNWPNIHYTPRPFYKYDVGGKKTVYVYWVVSDSGLLELAKLKCPSMVEGTNKPEIDSYAWVTADQAIDMVTESQKDLFRHVKQLTLIN